ncbi:afadin- and alpha-actinin-binding protein B [Aplysia californica]|uniref:Afadin- and alpha-actinin-binding protein B n=1 Tax=Aplysia californica TaxID=6500 RepID=A0ABM0JZZ9_APLCA|nr:afadin- and alpha-actinin-binding protein B [Aplysia californica]
MSGWSMHNLMIPPDSAMRHSQYSVLGDQEELNSDFLVHADSGDYSRNSGPIFCTRDNLLNSVAYINQELELLGLSCLRLDTAKGAFDTVSFVNRMYDLLTLYHKTLAVKENVEERNHKLSCESEHRQSVNLRMKHLQEQVDRELAKEQEKFRQINVKYKQICSKVKTEKEEAKRLTAAIHSKEVQHRHELKKKEREIHRLKERLHQLLADKVPDRKVGMDLMHVVGLSEGRRATWKVGLEKQEEEMYQLLINNYEERHHELMQENSELRDCLLALHRELSALLKHTGDMSSSSGAELSFPAGDLSSGEESDDIMKRGPRLSMKDLEADYFQMPYDMVRKEVERTFKETCQQISESMKKSLVRTVTKGHPSIVMSQSVTSASGTTDRDTSDRHQGAAESMDVEKLKKQIQKYKSIIQQQEELIQQSLTSQSHSVESSFLHESQLLKEKENLSEQKRLFFEEKANFEKERRAYTEAAVRLGRERQALHEERSNFLKQHFLNLSPFKEKEHRKQKIGGGSSNRLLPATPVFSPARSKSKDSDDLPTAADLFKVLGLSPLNSRLVGSPDVSQSSSGTEAPREGVPVSSTPSRVTPPPNVTGISSVSSETNPARRSSADASSVGLDMIKASLLGRSCSCSRHGDSQNTSSSTLKRD